MKTFEAISFFTYYFSKLVPKKRNRWVFGAWFGNSVSDNTKAFYDYVAANHPEIERIWVSSDPSKVFLPGCKVIKRNRLSSLRYILTAKVAVMNQGFGDLAAFNFLGGTYKVQLWHGVAWKKIGRDAYPKMSEIYEKVFQTINRYDMYIAPSKTYAEVLKSAFKTDDDHVLLTGQPRNEVLFSGGFLEESRKRIEDAISVKDKKLIVYMPTFRDKTADVFSFHMLEKEKRFAELARKHNFVIVEKLHYKNNQKSETKKDEQIVYGLPDMEAAVLLGAADLLITDYSSCFFDYLITDRPVIHFTYDYEYYKKKDRGLYYEREDVMAGALAENEEELLTAIDDSLTNDQYKTRRHEMRKRFITYESNHSCEDIYTYLIKKMT